MFTTGDKIVYPMHGAGIIESIEEKSIMGEIRRYYTLHIPFGDIKIMIPCDSCEKIGVREIINREELSIVYATLSDASTEMSNNWNRRYRDNMEKLKTGEAISVAEVVRNLMRIDKVKKLSTGEKKMLSNAKQILVSELILVEKSSPDEEVIRIEEYVCNAE